MIIAATAVIATFTLLLAPVASGARIEVVASTQHMTRIAFFPKGRGGDVAFGRLIIRSRHGRVIGDLLLDCRWVTATLRFCVAQLGLPLGSLALIGASRTRFLGQFAVVGGTGRYKGADGALLFRQIDSGKYVLSVDYEVEDE